MDDDFLTISSLQSYAYCPRQFALINVEREWVENELTVEGEILHQRVDSGLIEERRGVRYERSVLLRSERHRIIGKTDVLEVHLVDPIRYFPVEYKKGRPKTRTWDKIQLCAQALCIEEMRDARVIEGALWYWETRRREPVEIDEDLRAETIKVISGARRLMDEGITPPPIREKRLCRRCAQAPNCEPGVFRTDRSVKYIKEMFAV